MATARQVTERGHRVLAVDGDPNPSLALQLGISPERMESGPALSSELVERTEEGYRLTRTLEEVCGSHSLPAPELEIVLAGLRGDRSVKDVCREHEIAETLYYSWRDKLIEGARAALGQGPLRAKTR